MAYQRRNKLEGITLLVEIYGGKRTYWFYIGSETDYNTTFENLCTANPDKRLDFTIREDREWKFVEEYPLAFRGISRKSLSLIVINFVIALCLLYFYCCS